MLLMMSPVDHMCTCMYVLEGGKKVGLGVWYAFRLFLEIEKVKQSLSHWRHYVVEQRFVFFYSFFL